MDDEINLLHKRLENEHHARQEADTLLEQKSLELWEMNQKLQRMIDSKTQELQTLNDQLSIAFEDKSQELSEQVRLLNEYKKAVDYSTIVSITDTSGIITYINDAFSKVSGYSSAELIGRAHNIIRHPDNPPELFAQMWKTLYKKQPWQGVLKNQDKNGSAYYVDTTITPILNEDGEIEKFLALRNDITKVIHQEEQILQHLTDRLTGLPSRLKLLEDLESENYVAICLLNLDSFQELNNLYGHKIGDEILRYFGIYLAANLNEENCYLYKLPSDEFAILSHLSLENELFKNLIIHLIRKLESHMFYVGGYEIYLSVTAGMSCGKSVDMLINADIALKNAKRNKLPYELFDAHKHEKEQYANNQEMIKTLRYALASDLVIAYFQPIYNNLTNKIDKYETLMRIVNEEGKVISPFFFLDVAHKSKIYPELTKVILRKAFEMFYDKDISFTVNLSIEDIRNSDTHAYIFDMLGSFEKPENVVFEIIESEGIDNYDIVKQFVKEVKKYNAHIAIDDFGSGYSNFMHLLELEANTIKIDGSIIKKILDDRNSQILTKTIVLMAAELKMNVVAEFVSSKEIQEMVISMGVDHSQGYYLGEPKPYLIDEDNGTQEG